MRASPFATAATSAWGQRARLPASAHGPICSRWTPRPSSDTARPMAAAEQGMSMTETTAGGMQVDTALVRQLAELLDETRLSEIEVQDGERRIRVARGGI